MKDYEKFNQWQEEINLAADPKPLILKRADEVNGKYPQYKNKWDHWIVAVMNAKVGSRFMNNAFHKGDIVLMQPQTGPNAHGMSDLEDCYVCYSVRNGIGTIVKKNHVKEMECA